MESLTSSWLFICMLLPFLNGEVVFNCPEDWPSWGDSCYYFALSPEVTYDAARTYCGDHGASLLGIASQGEHQFVSSWLLQNDIARQVFYTSGVVHNMDQGHLVWEKDGSTIPTDLQFWRSEEDRLVPFRQIVYTYSVTGYTWSRVQGTETHLYICEIPREEAYRIIQENRDFDYGLETSDPAVAPYGPRWLVQPVDLVAVGQAASVIIDCAAVANPQPSYRVTQTLSGNASREITAATDSRYTLSNGRLTIEQPSEMLDGGRYHCQATNQFGTVVSHEMLLSFGRLGEFSNVEREPVRAQQHYQAVMACVPPLFNPAVTYNWMKGHSGSLVRPDLNPHLFVSHNGKLYFSEVSASDESVYRCLVKLTAEAGREIGSTQPPTRVSLPIQLIITNSLPTVWGPEISNDFIATFPSVPLRGYRLRLECLAYGTMPISYSWRRNLLPLPTTAVIEDHGRVLTIPEVQLEDSGTYFCRAWRGTSHWDEKSVVVRVEAEPFWVYPLHDMHVDVGRTVTWRCEAKAVPPPTYSWYRNGTALLPVPGQIEISANKLVIRNLDPVLHNAMYQCGATNFHGTTFSAGQLRVLGFRPTFHKRPLESVIMAPLNGNATIICSPEAAPFPRFQWAKDGRDLNLPDGDTTSRVRKLQNGHLFISPVQASDPGIYTCTATNQFGTNSSSGRMEVVSGPSITAATLAERAVVNSTAFLRCQASAPASSDLVYKWFFQNRAINLKDPHFVLGDFAVNPGLYVRNVQLRHRGMYTCTAATSFARVSRNITLDVRGPPGPPGGVYMKTDAVTAPGQVQVWWTDGASHGETIVYYSIFFSSMLNPAWRPLLTNIPARDAIVQGREQRMVVVSDLKPGNSYRFSVSAINVYGQGEPSEPSIYYQTAASPPVVAPSDVGGGGGSVGDLTVNWTVLHEEDHGGPGIGYRVFWRSSNQSRWNNATAMGNVDRLVITVYPENFWMPYEVKVQAFNNFGSGPNSSIVVVFSAEDIPIGTPTNINAFQFNSTALNVTFDRLPNTRDVIKGFIRGYQVNYWPTEQPNPLANSYGHRGEDNNVLIIGLEPYTMYTVDVQVFNWAGLGPRSEMYSQRTWALPPQDFPTEVHVFSHGSDSVHVTWRGISSTIYEETLNTYIAKYWPTTEDIRTAVEWDAGARLTETVLYGIQPNIVYRLRLCGRSRAGDGKMSQEVFFTLGGQVRIDQESTEIRAAATSLSSSILLVFMVSFLVSLAMLHAVS